MEINSTNEENASVNEEHNQEEKSESGQVDSKKARTIKIIVVVILLLLPIAFIFYKTTGNSNSAQNQPAAPAPGVDVAAYESAANTNPTFSNLLNLSNAYINKGMPGKSIEPLKKAIAQNPKSAVAYSNLGLAYTMLLQYKEGIESLEKAVQFDSTFQLAKNNLNWAKSEQKKLLDAIRQMEQTPENKRDAAFYNGLGLYYLKLQDHDKSIETFNKILVKDPQNSAALNNIGTAFMSKSQYDDAIKHFQKAIEFNSNDQLAKNNLAWALDEKKKATNR